MKSAYLTLGLPGDAKPEEIREALSAAQSKFTKAHLVQHPEDIERLQAIREAGKILLDPEMRAAHDRKLSTRIAKASPPVRYVVTDTQPQWFQRPILIGAMLVGALFAAGAYLQHANQERQRALALIELEKKKIEEQEAQQKQELNAKREALVAKMNDEAKANEAKLRHESLVASRNAEIQNSMALAQQNQRLQMDRMEAQRKESAERSAKYQAAAEAQRNLAIDQQRIRNLCLQNYGRYNC
jgi:hypothetical protein